MSEPTHYKQKQEKSGDTIAENKHRKEEKQKTIFFFPQKIFAKREKKDEVGLPLASPDMLYKERTPKTNLRGSQSGGYLLSHNIPQCSTIGDALSASFAPLRSLFAPSARRRRAHRRPPRASDAFFLTQRPPLTHDYIKSMVSLFNTVFVLLTSFLLVSL